MNTLLALLAIMSYGTHSTSTSATIYREPEMTPITITATAEWTEWPKRVCCNSSALYTKPLPPCPVRLATKCRARSEKGRYIDTWDGFMVGDVHKGIRVYLDMMTTKFPLATSYVNGQMYIIDGVVPQAGRIYATSITPVK
jgi:hypothetical protein